MLSHEAPINFRWSLSLITQNFLVSLSDISMPFLGPDKKKMPGLEMVSTQNFGLLNVSMRTYQRLYSESFNGIRLARNFERPVP